MKIKEASAIIVELLRKTIPEPSTRRRTSSNSYSYRPPRQVTVSETFSGDNSTKIFNLSNTPISCYWRKDNHR